MARAIVYPKAVAEKTRAVRKGRRKPPPPTKEQKAAEATADGYRTKLVKYVPAEATAFFTLAFGALDEALAVENLADRLWWVLVLGVGLGIALLFATVTGPDTGPLPWYNYVLTGAAFLAWSIGTTPVAQEIFPGWVNAVNDVVLAAAVFIIPGLDQLLTRRVARQQA